MAKLDKEMRFVILAESMQENELGVRYIGTDGLVTALRARAAKFETVAAAHAFAARHQLRLGDGLRIGREHFVDFELLG